jgi:hypothetical protein
MGSGWKEADIIFVLLFGLREAVYILFLKLFAVQKQ